MDNSANFSEFNNLAKTEYSFKEAFDANIIPNNELSYLLRMAPDIQVLDKIEFEHAGDVNTMVIYPTIDKPIYINKNVTGNADTKMYRGLFLLSKDNAAVENPTITADIFKIFNYADQTYAIAVSDNDTIKISGVDYIVGVAF